MDSDVLSIGRDAYARRAWAIARDSLVAARAAREGDELEGDDLERLATAAYLSGEDRLSSEAWVAGHRLRLADGDIDGAVRCAFWLAFGLLQRGEGAEGGGWLARAEQLAADHSVTGVSTGYLLVPKALHHLDRGDAAEALDVVDQVGSIARRFEDRDLLVLSVLGRGQALCRLGRSDEGVARFDEAMVAVTNGEVSPVIAGIVYCAVIAECQRAFDVARAYQWTAALSRWCDDQPELVPYRGQCLVHRAQILQLRGAWDAANTEAERARDRLSQPVQPAIGMAHYQLGELQRLRGELADAAESYQRAQETGRSPHPGLAMVLFASGELDAAAASIDAALNGANDAASQTQNLPAYVEIMLAVDRVDDARRAAAELQAISLANPTAFLRATSAHALGAVRLHEGDPPAALASLRGALTGWSDLEAPYEAARCRVLLAAACRALGDDTTADLELQAARRTFVHLGARLDLARTDEPALTRPDTARDTVVTDRELQVLRRVASGATNTEIADDLFVSVKTVERHLSTIYRKLGVPNRAAATAAAIERELLAPD